MRLAFRVSYLGTRFFGSQMQASERTVEAEFIAACRRLSLLDDWRQAGFQSAGRTDRGVHARGQVIAFSTDVPERAVSAINTQLPPDIWCTRYSPVPEEFHPRYDARSRTYRYYFSQKPPFWKEMERASRDFLGIHDFTNFARVRDKNPERKILSIRIGEEERFVFLEVTAESFLWHQVRCMASALLRIGIGESPEDSIEKGLNGTVERPFSPAPAEGLILWDTDCGLRWNPLPERERSALFLDHLGRHYALMGRICTDLNARDVP